VSGTREASTLLGIMNDRSIDGSVAAPTAVLLLDAVERVFAHGSPSTVSMRSIAREAGCSVGLAYNYFASKDELIGAALDRMGKRIALSATSTDDPREAMLALLDSMRANAAFPRLVTWLVLEGHDVSSVMSGHPLMQSVGAVAAARGAEDPTSVAMTMGLVAMGTFTYSEMLNRAVGRQSDDGRLLESAADMFASWFPPSIS
jgi:AcrR family transcriptional regulator